MVKQTKRPAKHKKLRPADVLAVAVLLCIALVLISSAIRYVKYLLLEFATVEAETVTAQAAVDLLVIRDEEIIYAPVPGNFIPTAAPGSRINAGGVIGYMEAEQNGSLDPLRTDVVSQQSGIVYFILDGWETKLSVAALDNTDRNQLINIYESESVQAAALEQSGIDNAASGRPVAKIVDNLSSYHLLVYGPGQPDKFIHDEKTQLSLDNAAGKTEIRVRVYEQGKLDDGRFYLLVEDTSKQELLKQGRHFQAELVGATVRGIFIDPSAVFTNAEGKRGVYCVENSFLAFREVEVQQEVEGRLLVSGLNSGERIVINYQKASLGQRVYN